MSKAQTKFEDLGKDVDDLLKDFEFGKLKLEVNTNTNSGVKFTLESDRPNDSGDVNATLKAKYTNKAHGIVATESWDTKNKLQIKSTFEPSALSGIKLIADASYTDKSDSFDRMGKIGFEVSKPNLSLITFASTDSDPKKKLDQVSANASVSIQNVKLGVEGGYSVDRSAVLPVNVKLAYVNGDFNSLVFGSYAGFKDATKGKGPRYNVGFSFYNTIKPSVNVGAKVFLEEGKTKPVITVAGKYALDSDTTLRGKVDTDAKLAAELKHSLRKGIKVGLTAELDGKKIHASLPGVQVGVSLALSDD